MRKLIFPLTLLVLLIVSMFFYTVREDQYAMVLRLGQIVKTNVAPGLHFRIPLYNSVVKFDSRVLSLDTKPERYLTGEKKHVLVDSVVKWRIADAGLYYQTTQNDELAAGSRISQIVKDRLRDEFNKRALRDVVSSARDDMMEQIRELANEATIKSMGIKIVDVRIKRIELPEEVSESVFQRMQSERKQVAFGLRAGGQQQAEQLRAEAEKQAKVIVAEAERTAQSTRGEGDAKASEIYAQAYGGDVEFYTFYRSLEAYRTSFKQQGNVLVLDPQNEFFKYFQGQRTP